MAKRKLTGAALAGNIARLKKAIPKRAFESYAAGAIPGIGGASAEGGIAAGLSSKLKGGAGSAIGKGGLAAILTYMLLQSRAGKELGMRTTGLESESLERRTRGTKPEDMFYQAMMPSVRAQQQMAQQMLLRQIGVGGVAGPSLASGEELIG